MLSAKTIWSAYVLVFLLYACGGGGSGPSTTVNLSSLTLSSGTLSPAFEPSTTTYTALVGVAQVRVTPTATNGGVMIFVNGTTVLSGQESDAIALTPGANDISVVVSAARGSTTKTYTIIVTCIPFTANADLASLSLSGGTLSPAFDSSVSTYTASVDVSRISVTPTAADAGAAIAVNGTAVLSGQESDAIALTPGVNEIATVVTADDRVTGKTYTIIVTYTPPSTDADLASLTVSAGVLNPGFDPATTSYTAMFITEASLTVTPASADPGAVITVNGTPVPSGQASAAIALKPGRNPISIVVTAADGITTKTYSLAADRLSEEAYLKASNTGAGDQFGYAVVLSGNTLAIGAPDESSNAFGIGGDQGNGSAPSSGAVYVFTRTGATWTQQAYIKASNTGAGDYFGWSLALAGDTLAVGALYEDSNAVGINGDEDNDLAQSSGAVYVFARVGETWIQQAYIKASNTGGGDQFGHAVALSGDSLAVGAVGEDSSSVGIDGTESDNGASSSGAVYVFSRTGETWTQQSYIKASNTGVNDYFGWSVALSGDTLAVGALHEQSNAVGIGGDQGNNAAQSSGAVYVFTRTGAGWTQQAYIKASNPGVFDNFGWSMALSGDTLAVGAPDESSDAVGVGGDQSNDFAPSSGAVYVFTRTGGDWTQQAYIKASNTGDGDNFGYAVAFSGDALAVGALYESSDAAGTGSDQDNDAAQSSGAVYLFTRTGASWAQQAYIKASNAGASDYFGWSVALWGDSLAVGAIGEDSSAVGGDGDRNDNSAADSGAVYVLR